MGGGGRGEEGRWRKGRGLGRYLARFSPGHLVKNTCKEQSRKRYLIMENVKY